MKTNKSMAEIKAEAKHRRVSILAQQMATGLTYAELGKINGDISFQSVGQMIRRAKAEAGIKKKKKSKKKKCY